MKFKKSIFFCCSLPERKIAVEKKKKKIAFYSILSSGHLNVCSSIATVLLDKFSKKLEVYFIVDDVWAEKLSKNDARFKFGIINYDNKEQGSRIEDLVDSLEPLLSTKLVERMIGCWSQFLDWSTLPEIDRKSEEKIKEIGADFLICDQVCHFPSMQSLPYAFINSCNPCIQRIEGFPQMGDDSAVHEKEKIEKFKSDFSNYRSKMNKQLFDFFEERGKKFNNKFDIDQPISEHFTIYCYPEFCDYYSDEIRKKYNLWQIDSALIKVPKPYELPKEFKELPGQIIYVSLGSLFSAYVDKLQRLVDILDRLPYKYIVSKGPNGDKLKFPSKRFIGQNFIDQLAVLQVSSAMISHGGNNTFCECAYFGVPQIIMPAVVDQINNAKRVEECKIGFQLSLLNYTEEELKDRLNKLLNDKDLNRRLKDASKQIRSDNKIFKIADKIVDYLDQNLK